LLPTINDERPNWETFKKQGGLRSIDVTPIDFQLTRNYRSD